MACIVHFRFPLRPVSCHFWSSMMCFDAIVSSILSSMFRDLFRRNFMAFFLDRCRWPISVHRFFFFFFFWADKLFGFFLDYFSIFNCSCPKLTVHTGGHGFICDRMT
ncbi:hypothetical protein BDV37DRAFT_20853 [Aspergillus pseudonomiae]|uniref:Uncharacterized protein n=1 Tax=Aspergillus pseudonomiae TaxID=1506151 RepID=A0A5N7CYE1_9EURO|nr:uncharacterized protein BDV37DRAFT_20853 [Aspergillus pseudonomiae]KAE8398777.1 hypothetical protein BDV37DRAFT_20853 [Aspergillus pseudonomiae]